MLKATGIVLMTQFAAQVCRDMDAPSIACRAELCGRLMLLGVSPADFSEADADGGRRAAMKRFAALFLLDLLIPLGHGRGRGGAGHAGD